ncbi:GGDEF domain-containing protein [Candidatus Poribacteria bacterium]|nr:GGDEF domain-containing protein [Candidatus Poribacteria bacterium]
MKEKNKVEKYSIEKYTSKNLITVNINEKFKNIVKSMVSNKVSCLIVIDMYLPVGIITERDILRTIFSSKNLSKIYAYEIMSSPVLSVRKEFNLAKVIEYMKSNSIRRALVVDKKNIMIGLVTQTDLLKASSHELQNHNLYLKKLVDVRTKKLKQLTLTDELTKLFNRRYFNIKLKEHFGITVRYNQFFSCIMLDIDFFKKINDTYGHLCGDKILYSIAYILRKTLRSTDICCRWGGEEFILLLPCTELNGAIIVAERLRKKISIHPFKYENNNIMITASFGVVCYEKEIKNEREFINKVDHALYQAKINGRNRVFVETNLKQQPN